MANEKKYRLMKDLPYVKAGAIYELDVPEGTYVCDQSTAQFTEGTKWDGLGVDAVEKAAGGWFEQIFPPQEKTVDKFKVLEVFLSDDKFKSPKTHIIVTNQIIPTEKQEQISKAIEDIMNGEVGLLGLTTLSPSQPEFTKKQMNEAIEKAFVEGRKTGQFDCLNHDHPDKIKSSHDYIKSLNQ